MWAHLLLWYTHQVHIKYIIYIYKLFFLNQYTCMLAIHIQGYVNLRNYILFIPLDICKTYLYLGDDMCQKFNQLGLE